MTTITGRQLALALLGASTALAFAATPYALTLTGLAPAGAFAQESGGNDGGDSGGSDGGDSGGNDSGDSGGNDSGGDTGGSDGGDSGGNDSGGDTGGSTSGGDTGGSTSGGEIVNPTNRANIEIEHADGTREEIENGRYEMQDADGRTIVERPATDADRARLEDLAG